MIDTITEQIITLAQVAEGLPRRKPGRKTHISTIYRWTTRGCRGVILESIQIGATRVTSREALQRYCERLTQIGRVKDATPQCRSRSEREQRSEAAGRSLEALKI